METKERKGLKERRERILKAAKKVIAKKGFEAATVDEIAELAGVGKGTIYRRVGDKKQLLHALLHQAADSLAEKIAHDTKKEVDPVKKLKLVMTTMSDWYEENLDLAKLFFASVHSYNTKKKSGSKKHKHKEEHLIFKTINQIIIEGKKKKAFAKNIDPAFAVGIIFHLLTPFYYEELRQIYKLTPHQTAGKVFNLIYKGLKA